MENKEVISGKPIVLECMASGSPKPTLIWLKDNKTMETTERHFFAADNQLLIIVDAKFSDNGQYKCEVTNNLGSNNGYTNLTVNPIIISHTFNFNDMIGVVVITIFCCVVVTSCIWVIIIYHAKKRNNTNNFNNSNSIKCQYSGSPTQKGETSFNDVMRSNVMPLTETPNTRARIYMSNEGRLANYEELDPLHNDNIDEPDGAASRPSSVIIRQQQSSCDNISLSYMRPSEADIIPQSSPLPSPPPTPVPTPPSPYDSMTTSTPIINDNTLNIDDIESRMTQLNQNLLENKLNKYDNLIMNGTSNMGVGNGGGGGGGGGGIANTNSKISCISICSLDSVHSLKQSL